MQQLSFILIYYLQDLILLAGEVNVWQGNSGRLQEVGEQAVGILKHLASERKKE